MCDQVLTFDSDICYVAENGFAYSVDFTVCVCVCVIAVHVSECVCCSGS